MIIVALLFFSLPLLENTNAKSDSIALKNYPEISAFKEFLSPQEIILLGDIILLPAADFDHKAVTFIIARINSLPSSMLRKIKRKGIKIKLFTGKLTDLPTAKHLKGVTPRGYTGDATWDDVPGIGGSKLVLVKIGASEQGNGHGSVNLELHELAHSVDRLVYDEIRHHPSFLTIWEQEKTVLFPGQSYFNNYPEEYFAETFAMYYLGTETRQLLSQKAPKTFEFFQSLK